jgi:nitrate/nitrite-specific signal transduction histidine kinase
VPIIVDGRLWGAMGAAATEQLPPDAESRIGEFTELVATAIANIEARAELTASRARIVAAADEERRRVVRDLHDGPQQRLVHAVVMLKLSQRALEGGAGDAPSVVGEALELAQRATRELRELVHGILPAALTSGGLRGGVGALASRVPVPVQTEICAERMPAPIEATAYFVVAEALPTSANHRQRRDPPPIAARVEDGTLRVEVRDDRVGGARREGSGLQGLADRLAALDGRLEVKCPPTAGHWSQPPSPSRRAPSSDSPPTIGPFALLRSPGCEGLAGRASDACLGRRPSHNPSALSITPNVPAVVDPAVLP